MQYDGRWFKRPIFLLKMLDRACRVLFGMGIVLIQLLHVCLFLHLVVVVIGISFDNK